MKRSDVFPVESLLPVKMSPIRSYRYIVKISEDFFPSYKVGKFSLKLKKKKAKVSLLVHLSNDDIHFFNNKVLNFIKARKTFNISCEYLDETGQVIGKAWIGDAKIKFAKYSDLDYSSDSTANVELFFDADINNASFE